MVETKVEREIRENREAVEAIWGLSNKELMDALSRPVDPNDKYAYLVVRVAVSRIFKMTLKLWRNRHKGSKRK